MNEWLECWKKYAVFSGRARRKEYWTFVLVNIVISVLLGKTGIPLLAIAYSLAVLLPTLSVGVRRFRDAGSSVEKWAGLHLLALASGVAVVKMGSMRVNECPVLLFALTSTVFLAAMVAVVWVLCSRSYDSDDAAAPRQSRFRIAVMAMLGLGAVAMLVFFVRSARLRSRGVDANVERLSEIQRVASSRADGDRAYRLKEHNRHAQPSPAIDSQKGESEAGQNFATIFSNIKIPVPNGYKIVGRGTPEYDALSALDAEPTVDGETMLRLLRTDVDKDVPYDGMLKVAVNRRLMGTMMSEGNFRLLVNSMASELEALKNKRNIGQTIRGARNGIRGNAGPASEDPLSAIEILSVRNNILEGLFTSSVRHEIADVGGGKEDYWVLVTQGIILARGRVLFAIRYKRYEDRDSAVENAAVAERIVRDWCRGIDQLN